MALSKTALLTQLREANIARVRAEYSGSVGEGYVDAALLFGAAGELVHAGGSERRFDPEREAIIEALYAFVHAQLKDHSPGWRLRAGGKGQVRIEVAAGTIHFDHGLYEEPTLVLQPFQV